VPPPSDDSGIISDPAGFVYRSDVGAVRKDMVEKFGFPRWWPMPDVAESDRTKLATFTEIRAYAAPLLAGTAAAEKTLYLTHSTRYSSQNPDLAALEKEWAGRISAGSEFAAADAEVSTGFKGEKKYIRYAWAKNLAKSRVDFSMEISEATETPTEIALSLSTDRPGAFPTEPSLTQQLDFPVPAGSAWSATIVAIEAPSLGYATRYSSFVTWSSPLSLAKVREYYAANVSVRGYELVGKYVASETFQTYKKGDRTYQFLADQRESTTNFSVSHDEVGCPKLNGPTPC
jgi:hypothetical protein